MQALREGVRRQGADGEAHDELFENSLVGGGREVCSLPADRIKINAWDM